MNTPNVFFVESDEFEFLATASALQIEIFFHRERYPQFPNFRLGQVVAFLHKETREIVKLHFAGVKEHGDDAFCVSLRGDGSVFHPAVNQQGED